MCLLQINRQQTRSTQGDHNTTEKTKGGLNIFPCVGSILWEYGRISTSCTAKTLTSKTVLLDTPPIQMCARVIINASLNTKTGPFFKQFAQVIPFPVFVILHYGDGSPRPFYGIVLGEHHVAFHCIDVWPSLACLLEGGAS